MHLSGAIPATNYDHYRRREAEQTARESMWLTSQHSDGGGHVRVQLPQSGGDSSAVPRVVELDPDTGEPRIVQAAATAGGLPAWIKSALATAASSAVAVWLVTKAS